MAVPLCPNGTAPTTLQIMMIPRMMNPGGNRVNTIALTMTAFTTAAPRDRDPPLDMTLGDILSYPHDDLPRIGRGGITIQPIRCLLEVDANEQVIDFKGSFAVHPLPVRKFLFCPTVQNSYFWRT
jgi:hypothetical protein